MHGISYRPTDLSLLISFEDFHILIEHDCPEAVVHALAYRIDVQAHLLVLRKNIHLPADFHGIKKKFHPAPLLILLYKRARKFHPVPLLGPAPLFGTLES